MTKKMKKLAISCMAVLTAAFAIWGTNTAIKARAANDDVSMQAATPFDNFQMIDGAGVRYKSDDTAANGLRFGVEYSRLQRNV